MSGIAIADSSTVMVIFLLMPVEVESRLPHGYLPGTSLPVKFCYSVLGVKYTNCLLLFQCCPFSSAIPFRLGQEHASQLILELALFFSELLSIPSSHLGVLNSICLSPLPPGLLPGLEETWESTRY